MQAWDRQQVISRLQARIETIENRPALDGRQGQRRQHIEKALANGFTPAPAGLLHEIWTDETRNAGAASGFALGQAQALLGTERLAVLWLQLTHEAQQTGLPYRGGLCHFGFDPEALIIGRVKSVTELLWATEEAAGCKAVAAIIVDIIHPGTVLDFTASRRLALRAQEGDSSIFLLRYGREREASATNLRWHISPILSETALFDVRAPGAPRWQVHLEKGQGALGNRPGQMRWILGWTENGFALEKPEQQGQYRHKTGPALSGAPPGTLGHGLSETA